METYTLLFILLTSFFGIDNGRFSAEKTTITLYPKSKKIEIIQEDMFAFLESEEDRTLLMEQWDALFYWKERKTPWSIELDSFLNKNLTFTFLKNTIQAHLMLTYSNQKDLETMGILYDKEENDFFIHNNPRFNIKTKEGQLVDDYWMFNGNSRFSFTMEPFLQLPEEFQKLKQPLIDFDFIEKENKKE